MRQRWAGGAPQQPAGNCCTHWGGGADGRTDSPARSGRQGTRAPAPGQEGSACSCPGTRCGGAVAGTDGGRDGRSGWKGPWTVGSSTGVTPRAWGSRREVLAFVQIAFETLMRLRKHHPHGTQGFTSACPGEQDLRQHVQPYRDMEQPVSIWG